MRLNNKFAIFFAMIFSLSLGGCFENLRPNAPPKRVQKKTQPKATVYQPPRECEDIVTWVLPASVEKRAADPSSRPSINVTQVIAEARLGEVKITAKTSELIQPFFDYTGPQGFKFGAALLDIFFDKDVIEHWGFSSAWENETEAVAARKDEYWVRIELGYTVLPELGGRPVERTGPIEVDAIKHKILNSGTTYSLKRINSSGKWVRVHSPSQDSVTGLPSFKTFTEIEGATVTIRIPYGLLSIDPRDVLVLHGKIPRKSKPPRLSFKCLKVGY